MFTGIIETLAKVENKSINAGNIDFWLSCKFTHELKVDQSVAHNGVCLTVVEIKENQYRVTAIEETLNRTNLKNWELGTLVNLERCMPADGRFDGHIVQGHVDQTATCTKVEDLNGSWKFHFKYNPDTGNVTVVKGSICINGTSLTVVDSEKDSFSVCIIPYTYDNTVFHKIKEGTVVNLEFDIVGKYIAKHLSYLK